MARERPILSHTFTRFISLAGQITLDRPLERDGFGRCTPKCAESYAPDPTWNWLNRMQAR